MPNETAVKTVRYKIFKGGILSVEALNAFLHTKEMVHGLAEVITTTMGHGALAVSKGALAVAAGSLISPLALTFTALIFLAETGVNYRRYKKGKITKSEFKKLVAHGAVGSVGSLIGISAGVAIGFSAGSALFPVVGSIIGAGIGAVGGFLLGKYLSLKMLKATECSLRRLKKRI